MPSTYSLRYRISFILFPSRLPVGLLTTLAPSMGIAVPLYRWLFQ